MYPEVILCNTRGTDVTLWEPLHFPTLTLKDEEECNLWRIWVHSTLVLCWSRLFCAYTSTEMKMSSWSSQECFLLSLFWPEGGIVGFSQCTWMKSSEREWKTDGPATPNGQQCSWTWLLQAQLHLGAAASCHCSNGPTPLEGSNTTRFVIWIQMRMHTV